MNKLVAFVLCFCIALPAVLGTCPPQAVLTTLGLGTVQAGTAALVGTANFCTRLTANSPPNTCCLLTDINAFQTTSDTIREALKTSVGKKDQAILDARRNVRLLSANYTALWTLLNASKANLDEWATQTTDTTLQTNAGKIKTFWTGYNTWFTNVLTNYDGIFKGFDTYQTNRATCIGKLLEVKSNLKCLACGADSDSSFTGNPAVNIDADATNTKNALAAACYDYINGSAYQSNILNLNAYNTSLTTLISAATLLANKTSSGAATFVATMTTVSGTTRDPAVSMIPSSGCTSASACDWVTTTLLANGAFGDATTSAATVLGGASLTLPARRALIQHEGNGRSLAWTYTTTVSGVNTVFPPNPAGVKNVEDPNPLSAFRVGVISSLVAIFIAFLF